MAIAQRRYALILLALIAIAWGVTLFIPRVEVSTPVAHTPTELPQSLQVLARLPMDAPVAEIIATVQVQTGLLLTREDVQVYQSLIRQGYPSEQALHTIFLYRQALLHTL